MITTYINKPHHIPLLKECIRRIQLFHPDSDIIILNDSHDIKIDIEESENLKIQKTKYYRCGEINAYAWACENINNYNKFYYIHDSTFLITRIAIDLNNIHYRPFWYSSSHVHDNMTGPEVTSIINKFKINNKEINKQAHRLQQGYGSIVFGGMAIFDTVFLEFLINKTNFLSVVHLFTTRNLRCFFERLLYIILSSFYDINKYSTYSICGDIIDHENAFNSNVFLNLSISRNPYIVKIWQGR